MENGKNRLQQTQDDVEEVKVIMLDNLNKAEEKSEKLHELEDRADELHSKMNEASWSPWVRQRESRTCHEVHPAGHIFPTLPRWPVLHQRTKKANSQKNLNLNSSTTWIHFVITWFLIS
ncbi:uncharacterized protein LOC129101567 isoform X1 [Anoplopoma fimbria]|uniref:uncharacterized protein LOC129101567 isoform X1 n=1 Tax=Anoplopoma fimbria TaxID=229290 RepID=UPI0023EC7683|nr:uncharacterized protein LOC129101567 isoform X1 [Anoplopoma fimbria]